LARRYGINLETAAKWRKRSPVPVYRHATGIMEGMQHAGQQRFHVLLPRELDIRHPRPAQFPEWP
jgi:hypothetical protein